MTDVVVATTELERRTIRRSDWVACNSAFIDCRTPGSDQKENYAFIGSCLLYTSPSPRDS